MTNEKIKFKANLQRVGTIIPETLVLLEELNRNKNWNKVKQKALSENILSKKSSTTITGILRSVRNRYFDVPELPPLAHLSMFVSSNISEKTKIQALFPYTCKTDPLIECYIRELVKSTINSLTGRELLKDELLAFLENKSKTHLELRSWSEKLKKRWVRGLLALLRDYEFMEPAPHFTLNKPFLITETFAFFLLNMLFDGNSGIAVINHDIWDLYLMSENDIERNLIETQKKGWINYQKAADMTKISANFNSMEAWINECLG